MARYIRTKDRIYEIESDFLNNKAVRVGYNVVGQEEVVLIENNSIIQSDSIEELCDEIVGIDNTYGHQFLRAFPYKCAYYWNGGVYGAIWTDKGLIYVAKLNSKGELELI